MITTQNRISRKSPSTEANDTEAGNGSRTGQANQTGRRKLRTRVPVRQPAGGGRRPPASIPANVGGQGRTPASSHGNQPCEAELELLAQRLEQHKAAAKLAYAEADLVEAELIQRLGVGGSVLLTDGRRLAVNDNFLDKNGEPRNVAYKPCGVRRFEVTVK